MFLWWKAANKVVFVLYSISIPPQGDAFDSIREEYTTILQNQLARGNNGLIKTKYLTFGIDADSIKAAKPRLERIEPDILNNFKRLGVAARTLDGKERLSQLHASIDSTDDKSPKGTLFNKERSSRKPSTEITVSLDPLTENR